jgi:FKBP-type peptidyl-prolyl cis-trans isomerase FkpA
MKKITLLLLLCAAITLQLKAQDGFVHTPKGVLIKNITNNTGEKIKLNDVVTFDVVYKTEKDSLLGSTFVTGRPFQAQVQPSKNAADLMDAFPLMTAKDSAYLKIPTDSLFANQESNRPPFFPKGSYLICFIKIQKVQSLDAVMAEQKKLMDSLRVAESTATAKYIGDHKLTVKTTPSGLKYLITHPSLKHKPLKGDTVMVNYTGKTLDGKIFDSSVAADAEKAGLNQPGRKYEPIEVIIGTTPVIQGWTEGLLLLNEGSKAQFIIPSALGYGSQGNDAIAPFSSLVFDVEVVKIKPIKHPATTVHKKPVAKKHTTTTKKNS